MFLNWLLSVSFHNPYAYSKPYPY